jgi:hypothetical protein
MSALPELLLAPGLVAISIIASRRWGQRVGGLVSSFPAVVGPVLLIAAREHGASFTARSANGMLFGLATLAAFVVVYAKLAGRAHWSLSLASGWVAAGVVAIPIRLMAGYLGSPAGLIVATVALLAAYAALAPARSPVERGLSGPRGVSEVMLQMVLTGGLVAGLAAAAAQLGPMVGGMLAALPVLASVLATRTHRQDGAVAVVVLLRGMLTGMPGFVGFCAAIGLLIVPLGTVAAFCAAILVAVVLQIMAFDRSGIGRLARGAFAAGRP